MSESYVEIETPGAVYRFYGRGRWAIKRGAEWRVINGIFVPANVLHIAATYCEPPRTDETRGKHERA